MDPTLPITAAAQAERLGIIGILVLIGFWLGYLYTKERKENARLHAEILTNSKEMTTCMVGVQSVIASHSQVMNTIADHLRMLKRE